MTGSLFNESGWGHVNRPMKLHKRNILLFMDSVSSHGGASVLSISNVSVKFLPPNTTPGIIQAFKLHYQKHLLTHVMTCLDSFSSAIEISRHVTVLNTITWINKAWKAVEPITIAKSFHACGFPMLNESNIQVGPDSNEISSSVLTVQELLRSAAANKMEVAMDADEYTSFERDMPTENTMD